MAGRERGEGETNGRIRSGKMLGKRQRSLVMRRTTSMTSMPSAPKQGRQASANVPSSSSVSAGAVGTGAGARSSWLKIDYVYIAGVKMAAFLMFCGFCTSSLGPGKDTYIYRGEAAFCSEECRQRQIEKLELIEQNCSLTSIRETPPAGGGSDQSSSGGDAVAAA